MKLIRTIRLLAVIYLFISPAFAFASVVYVSDGEDGLLQPPIAEKTVVLTFDDGPSKYTAQILKILVSKQVKATFFVIGKEAEQYKMLREIYDDGHEIGNHTYSHTELTQLPDWRIQLELSINRYIIESQTNHSTRIFRPPYLGLESLTPKSRSLITKVDKYGYFTIGENVDAGDWKRPGAEQIVLNVTKGLDGGIILMHDGGGDRSQTVEALPAIINYYQQRGYKFMTVSQALGLSRDQLMPRLSRGDMVLSTIAAGIFNVSAFINHAVSWIILALIIASFARMVLVIAAAIVQSRRQFLEPTGSVLPVSIIVPAYNEAAVIQSCLKSILASDYRYFEVIVVDDGSKDNTFVIARAISDRRLKVIVKRNGGKASALNYGISLARANFVVAIDADTVFRPDTLQQLMRHFKNPQVAAVSGNTRIANRHKILTQLQSLEYVVGFNLERRMGDLFDCITVVPGAIGAFRKSVLQKIGGFTYDTLAEDTDLTLSIKEAGHQIVYDSSAVAYTEVPATVEDLLKQRFRWTFGTMQAVWKHRRSLFNPRHGTLGMVGLPYLLFFQILFPLVSPLFDVAVIIGLLQHQYHLILISLILYTAADIFMSGVALKLDGEKLTQLWLILPQRLIYRQLMYFVIVKALINVLRGNLVGWGSLAREGKHLAESTL